jgi:protein-arginine kinase activator protein McsA
MEDQVKGKWEMADQGAAKANGTKQCPYCLSYFQNLTMHKRFCKRKDRYKEFHAPEQPLNSIVSDIKNALKQHRHSYMKYSVTEQSGKEEMEIIVRIPLR